MKTDIWMPIYTGDYLKDTSHLTSQQHGIYLLLMIHYWNKGMLQASFKQCINIAKAFTQEEQEDVKFVLLEFFDMESGKYVQKRIEKELALAKQRKEKAVEKAKKAATARWDKEKDATSNASGMPQEVLEQYPSSLPSSSSLKSAKPIKTFLSDSTEYRLANLLLTKIRENNTEVKLPNLQTWSKHIDYLIRIDLRDPQEVANVIAWCQKDSFWQDNILSTSKLRDKYDQLILKMKKGSKNSQSSRSENNKRILKEFANEH